MVKFPCVVESILKRKKEKKARIASDTDALLKSPSTIIIYSYIWLINTKSRKLRNAIPLRICTTRKNSQVVMLSLSSHETTAS